MIEFISIETIKAVVVLMFSATLLFAGVYSAKRGKKEEGYTFNIKLSFAIVILICISLPFIEADNSQTTARNNLISFNNAKQLMCEGKDSNTYSVSRKNGWSREKNYFTKDSLLIRADQCEEE